MVKKRAKKGTVRKVSPRVSKKKTISTKKKVVSQPVKTLSSTELPQIPQLPPVFSAVDLIPQLEFLPPHEQRRIDGELRERQMHLNAHAKQLQIREKELEEWHKLLQHKEEQIVSKEKEYKEIERLKHELEDKEISLHYLRSEVDWLKTQATEKKPIKHKDELDRLHKVADAQPVVSEPVVEEVQEVTPHPAAHSIRQHMSKAYSYLEKHNVKKAKDEYEKIRVAYASFVAKNGPDQALYQDVVDLFTDIKLRL